MGDTLSRALSYTGLGWKVLPLHFMVDPGTCSCGCADEKCATRGKHPRLDGGHTVASSDGPTIRGWWRQFPGSNIGISCAASGFVTIDVDPRNGGDETLADIVARKGSAWLDTVSASTGGDGEHHLFAHPLDGDGNPIRFKGRLGPGIDVKADGYIVVDPSVHWSGGTYEWNADRSPFEREFGEMPAWLVDELQSTYVPKDYEARAYDGPEAKIQPILDGCSWMGHCHDDAPVLPEPEWYAMLGILGRCENGVDLAHEWSAPHPLYRQADTARKLAHALQDAGPATCAFIEDRLGAPHCASCPMRGRVKSPIVLGSGALMERPSGLPRIITSGRQARDVTTEAWTALEASNVPVRLGIRTDSINRIVDGPHGVRFEPLDRASLRYEMDRVAEWRKYSADGSRLVAVSPIPAHIVEDVLVTPNPPLPPLNDFATAPFIGRDGQLVSSPGYDAGTGIYLQMPPSLQGLSVPLHPTRAQVAAAVALIKELICDFPFVSEADRVNAIAMLLTPFVRPVFDDITPLFPLSAPTRGSGKGLLADVLTFPSAGTLCPRTTLPRKNDDELTKKIVGMLLEGRQHVHIDNVRGIVLSSSLESLLTSPEPTERILGKSYTPRLRQRLNWSVNRQR